MKAIIVCAVAILALGALVHGEDDIKFGEPPKRELETTNWFGASRICEPGSTKTIECNRCSCTEDGSNWLCTLKGCPPTTTSVLADPSPEA